MFGGTDSDKMNLLIRIKQHNSEITKQRHAIPLKLGDTFFTFTIMLVLVAKDSIPLYHQKKSIFILL